MNLEEAWRELGVGGDASPEVARRAYLRLLKTRKPEIDPVGFQRLRLAYERASAHIAARAQFAAAVARDAALAAAAASPAAPGADVIAAPPADADVAPDTEVVTAPLDGVVPPPPAGVVSAPPAAVLSRPAPAADPLPPPPVVPAIPPFPSPAEVDALLQARDFARAAPLLAKLLELGARHLGVPVPKPVVVVDVELALLVAEDRARARALDAAFRLWLRETGNEARLLRDHLAASHRVVRELLALPDDFDQEMLAAIALAARGGDLGKASPKLKVVAGVSSRHARAQAVHLRTYAPSLAKVLGPALDPPPTSPVFAAPPQKRPSTWGIGIIGMIAVNVIRVVLSMDHSTPSASHTTRGAMTAPLVVAAPPEEPRGGAVWVDPSKIEVRTTQAAAARVQKAAQASGLRSVANLAGAVSAALGTGRCDAARRALFALTAEEERVTVSPDLREATDVLADSLPGACPALDTDGG